MNGVKIDGPGATGNRVQSNFIGTDHEGTSAISNAQDGVHIQDASTNIIGGTVDTARNTISGNEGDGVAIAGAGSTDNFVGGNFIGIDAAGTGALGNQANGVRISDAPDNTIGGTFHEARNVISANAFDGILISGSNATGNLVQGNLIGTDYLGTGDLGNADDGVTISLAPGNTIGGAADGARNVIAGNGSDGVEIVGSSSAGNVVQANFIGTNVFEDPGLGNDANGIWVFSAPDNTIGGTTASERNIISGNTLDGILISGSGATGNLVQGNRIGTDAGGSFPLKNQGNGVHISQAPGNTIGATTGTTPGGPCTGGCNLVSGNGLNGIKIVGDGATGNSVQSNFIGTSREGTEAR